MYFTNVIKINHIRRMGMKSDHSRLVTEKSNDKKCFHKCKYFFSHEFYQEILNLSLPWMLKSSENVCLALSGFLLFCIIVSDIVPILICGQGGRYWNEYFLAIFLFISQYSNVHILTNFSLENWNSRLGIRYGIIII